MKARCLMKIKNLKNGHFRSCHWWNSPIRIRRFEITLLLKFIITRCYVGCTTRELWHHLTNRKSPVSFPLTLDQQAKCYIWSLLHEASSGIINFYVLQSARQDNLFTYRLVSNSGVRGSCWDHDSREDVTVAILSNDTNKGLSQVTTRWACSVCVCSCIFVVV